MTTNAIERRLRKAWHITRQRLGGHASRPLRLVVEKAPWLGDASSPVMLSIDDLTNAWHGSTSSGHWDHGGDWGGGLWAPDSALSFLQDRLLADYPEVRTTVFTVASAISAYTLHQPFAHAAPMDATEASREFFAGLDRDPRFELAYHGFNHGTAGETTEKFTQEFRGYPSIDAAVAQTRRGLEIFERATGRTPRGGKYGGWDYNEFAETAIDRSGFLWWCRDWMPRDVTGTVPDAYYDAQLFGSNLVVALPSTLHGHFWSKTQVDRLLARRQVISIEEHIAPVRPDGLVQTPNIVDDIEELRTLYAYLRGKNVWHATGTEVATYVFARERTLVYDVAKDGFSLHYEGRFERPLLTLRIDAAALDGAGAAGLILELPDGSALDRARIESDGNGTNYLATVPVMSGRYRVRPAVA